ncbi:uncharacterized protein SPPG_03070 [Spizellomyces punctatus DAOM BR117]|uniref:Alpha/beta hydrolase fold-3 domain-containing protein n=1 Tax=Spizellomyces punctatus (strain DAOM BR117) TaxID=645134 RepID=A0A0L0HII7_SPIPD|nr:uncharacterized protein SPPG_03070 [Spizellomyces punctatus DAOM BR117]KND01256.1 hypothetical protein SPPG_03070 [Spizellomyces punctatus DAOM BR117]|eukprot:XP_016609295.1 hypothetical protein SPPG_03070 [Spizellomyces punctatus DAOM BR117]
MVQKRAVWKTESITKRHPSMTDALTSFRSTQPKKASFARDLLLTKSARADVYSLHMLRPRWVLHLEAWCWRFLTDIGFFFHRRALPRPISPSFNRRIKSTLSPLEGYIDLVFYTPNDYHLRFNGSDDVTRYPVLVNFHGGGFTIGRATDDSRWATTVVQNLNCIVVSVDYRCAPEAPFPTAVEDGADAILWLLLNAKELKLDPSKLAVSGFSAGGNLAFTSLLRLQVELIRRRTDMPELSSIIKGIIAWYPSTDFTRPRIERRKTNIRPDKELPAFFTRLFDASYLYPPKTVDVSDPYLSPAAASDVILHEGLPATVVMYTCEWDELRDEAERFKDRLTALGKYVRYTMIEGVAHAWDKNPFGVNVIRDRYYSDACDQLRRLFHSTSDISESKV